MPSETWETDEPSYGGWRGHLRGTWHLAGLSFWRLLRSRQTVISLLLLLLSGVGVFAWLLRRERTPLEFVEDIVLFLYVPFLLPLFCLCYATPGIASDRDEGTLVYLLASPLPRPLVNLAKFAAALAASLLWTLGGLLALCLLSRQEGLSVFGLLWPTVLRSTLAYVALFHLFSVLFRRATIVALGYALFLETFVGNVPGIVKRVAISFYTNCSIFAAAEPLGMEPAGPRSAELYQPISGSLADSCLWLASLVLLLLSTWAFARREYV